MQNVRNERLRDALREIKMELSEIRLLPGDGQPANSPQEVWARMVHCVLLANQALREDRAAEIQEGLSPQRAA